MHRLYHAIWLWEWFASIGNEESLGSIGEDIRAFARQSGTVWPMTWTGMTDVDDYLTEFLARMLEMLGDDLFGLYLHGSAAMGAFDAARSDIVVLGISVGPLSATSKIAVANAVSESSLPWPGAGLEISIVTVDSARTLSDAPRYELHVNTQDSKFVERVRIELLHHATD